MLPTVNPAALPMQSKVFLKRFSAIVFGLVAPLAVLEIALRLGAFAQSKVRRDRPKEYFSAARAGSARDYPYAVQKPANTFRIVVVGDSFAFGDLLQFDDTFSKRLERWLNLTGGPRKAEVINLSKSGLSSFDELRLVKAALSTMNPDLILLDFTLNDPELRPYRETFKDSLQKSALDFELFREWRGLQFIRQRLKVYSSRAHFKQYYNDLFSNPETWNRCVGALTEMNKLASGSAVPFVAVIFPLFDHSLDNSYPFFDLHKKVQGTFSELGVPWLDLFDAYRGMEGARLTVIPGGNSHPNEIAHRIAAEEIYQFLRKNKLIPEELLPKTVRQRSIYDPLRLNTGTPASPHAEPAQGDATVTDPAAPENEHEEY